MTTGRGRRSSPRLLHPDPGHPDRHSHQRAVRVAARRYRPGWGCVRPPILANLFLNRDEEPLKEWRVRDLLDKYCEQAGSLHNVAGSTVLTAQVRAGEILTQADALRTLQTPGGQSGRNRA